MEPKQKAKGSWGVRFFIFLLGIVLGVLFFWLLSFVEGDIGRLKSPDRNEIRGRFVDASLDARRDALDREIETLNRQIQTQREQQNILSNSTSALQNTLGQLQKNTKLTERSEQILQESMAAFLQNQEKFQQHNQHIAELTDRKREKEDVLAGVVETIKTLEEKVDKEYRVLYRKYQFKVAVLKLAFLTPVFCVAAFFFLKFRTSAYWPLVWAAFLAAFLKMAMVAHEYFPSKYFKYIALLALIGIVVRFLVYLIKMIVAPKKELLIRQYQQHYDKCICPVCSKPIRTGPLRFIGGLHKKARVLAGQAVQADPQESYTCPSCGTNLYGKCDQCGNIRHSLLPYCEHCGVEKMDKQ